MSGKAADLGVDFVLLNEGTAVGNNIEFYAQILKCPTNVSDFTNIMGTPPLNNSRNKQ